MIQLEIHKFGSFLAIGWFCCKRWLALLDHIPIYVYEIIVVVIFCCVCMYYLVFSVPFATRNDLVKLFFICCCSKMFVLLEKHVLWLSYTVWSRDAWAALAVLLNSHLYMCTCLSCPVLSLYFLYYSSYLVSLDWSFR